MTRTLKEIRQKLYAYYVKENLLPHRDKRLPYTSAEELPFTDNEILYIDGHMEDAKRLLFEKSRGNMTETEFSDWRREISGQSPIYTAPTLNAIEQAKRTAVLGNLLVLEGHDASDAKKLVTVIPDQAYNDDDLLRTAISAYYKVTLDKRGA